MHNNTFFFKCNVRVDPFDPEAFKMWAQSRTCPAIPAVLRLFWKLINSGFKVFLLSGRDEEAMGQSTVDNLHNQGFLGYERLILRYELYYKSCLLSSK